MCFHEEYLTKIIQQITLFWLFRCTKFQKSELINAKIAYQMFEWSNHKTTLLTGKKEKRKVHTDKTTMSFKFHKVQGNLP